MRLEDLQILVEPSEYRHLNIGDASMLSVAVSRLRAMAPRATIRVLTDDPATLLSLCPDVVPVPARGRRAWVQSWTRFAPAGLTPWVRSSTLHARRRFPGVMRRLARAAMLVRHGSATALHQYLQAASQSDVVILSGMGALTDAFLDHAWALLETLELAMEGGAVTALMGQGIGPIRNEQLRERAARVLARADLIALREGVSGPALLRELGVAPERIVVTGDDAVELAYARRQETWGSGIGVNMRVAPYSGITAALAKEVASGIESVAMKRSAPLVSLPVSRYSDTDDRTAILDMFASSALSGDAVSTTEDLISRIGQCRVVVAASYHAAVFALSSGIPVVGVVSSDYYRMKFEGLTGLFGAGCVAVDLADARSGRKVEDALERLWEAGPAIRPELVAAAHRQIELGHQAYERLAGIIRERAGGRSFNLHQQTDHSWHDRTARSIQLLSRVSMPPGRASLRLADIGCGDLKLREALSGSPFSYEGFDLLPQSPEVRQFDVQKEALPDGYDVAVLLGVTEYLEDLEATLRRLAGEVPHLLISHVVREEGKPPSRSCGNLRWRTRWTRGEMEAALARAQFAIVESLLTADGATRLWLCASRGFVRE